MDMNKRCSKCKNIKQLSEFAKDEHKKSGYRSYCKYCGNKASAKYRKDHLEELRKADRKEYAENIEYFRQRNLQYSRSHKKENSLTYKKWRLNHKKELAAYKNMKYKTDPNFKCKVTVRKLIRESINKMGFKKGSKTEQILGCSFNEFKKHIESKFESWMNWNNYGKHKGRINEFWSIDHIVPLITAKTQEDIIKLNHYTNLQPLCDYTNKHIKRDKIIS